MTGRDFAVRMIDESGYQFKACLAGITEPNFVAKPLGEVMSIKETLQHHTECCIAVQRDFANQSFEWGTFEFPKGSVEELVIIFEEERAAAVELALENFETKPSYAKDYLIAHEFYHVGQMCAVRIALSDGFDPYSIYRF